MWPGYSEEVRNLGVCVVKWRLDGKPRVLIALALNLDIVFD